MPFTPIDSVKRAPGRNESVGRGVYDSLRAMPAVDELRIRQALQRVEQTRELLVDIQCTIEYLEDQERVA